MIRILRSWIKAPGFAEAFGLSVFAALIIIALNLTLRSLS